MRRNGWHVLHLEEAVILSRRLPVSFDISAQAHFPPVSRMILAHEVRKDLWRALRSLRGFAPAVRVQGGAGSLIVTAGGAVDRPTPLRAAEARIAALLTDPALRCRWIAHAGRGRDGRKAA